MSKEYNEFRVKTLESIEAEFPSANFRQKMKMVAEKWKQYRISSLTTLSQEEIASMVLIPNPSEETFKKLKHTIDTMTESEFAKLNHKGDPLLLVILENLFANSNNGDRRVHMLVHKYIERDEMYAMKTKEGLDILDLCIIYARHDVILKILSVAPTVWLHENVYNSKNQSRTSCLYGLLFINFDYIEHRQSVIDLIRNSIKDGLNPNLEIGDCVVGKDVKEVYKDRDEVFNYLLKTRVQPNVYSKFINYVGVNDIGKAYRERIAKIMKVKNPSFANRKQTTDCTRYVGETIFSVYLDKANNYRHRNYCESLFEMNVIDLKTVFVKNGKPSCYQNLLFEKNVKTIANVGHTVMIRTPTYFFYVPSAGRPLEVFIRSISTSWEFFIYSKTSIMILIEQLFKRFLVPPDTSILRKLVLHPKFSSRLLEMYTAVGASVSEYIFKTFPEAELLNTALAKLIIQPGYIDKVMTEIKAGNVNDWKAGFTKEYLKSAMDRFYSEIIVGEFDKRETRDKPMNDWFMISDEETAGYPRDGNLVFVSEDNYLFRIDELAFILEKSQNPFNRREFTMNEVLEIQRMLNKYYEWWFIYPIAPAITGPVARLCTLESETLTPEQLEIKKLEVLNEILIGLIDEYLEASPLFYYGEKLRSHVDKLHPPEKIMNAYLILLNNPSVLIGENDIGLLTSCIGFQRDHYDHSSIEEINIYYGLKFAQFSNEKNNSPPELFSRRILNSLLSWIYLILDSTDYHSNNDRLNGRLISLYFLILNFIR